MSVLCPIHKSEMNIESYSQDDYRSIEVAGSEQLSYIDGVGNKTFTAPLYKEIKNTFTVIYKCAQGCTFVTQQKTIKLKDLNRGLSRQIRKS